MDSFQEFGVSAEGAWPVFEAMNRLACQTAQIAQR